MTDRQLKIDFFFEIWLPQKEKFLNLHVQQWSTESRATDKKNITYSSKAAICDNVKKKKKANKNHHLCGIFVVCYKMPMFISNSLCQLLCVMIVAYLFPIYLIISSNKWKTFQLKNQVMPHRATLQLCISTTEPK